MNGMWNATFVLMWWKTHLGFEYRDMSNVIQRFPNDDEVYYYMRCWCCCCFINWYNVVAGSRSRSFQLTWYWFFGNKICNFCKIILIIEHIEFKIWKKLGSILKRILFIWLNNERLILLPIWTSTLIHDRNLVTWYQISMIQIWLAWWRIWAIHFQPDESL